MKILVVAEKDKVIEPIKKHLPPLGFDFIFYRNPVKAMDNLYEISPEMIIFSAEDYPRHWKPFLKVLREYFDHDKCVFILLKTSYFTLEDAEKSAFLGVNGLVDEDLDEYALIDRLKGIFSRYILPNETRRYRRYFVTDYDKVSFLFNHPETLELIPGKVVEISAKGATILFPEQYITQFGQGSRIKLCSLKIEDRIITVDCTILRSDFYTTIIFDNILNKDMEYIQNYFENRVFREMENNE